MRVLAVANRRGGVGKTCTAHAIGAALNSRGHRVLFVDLDSQCNLTFDLRGDSSGLGVYDLLTRAATAYQVIQHPEGAAGDLLPATPQLATADLMLTGPGKEYRLTGALGALSGLYDYCIVDTPPALGILTVNALVAAEGVIIPASAEVHSLQAIGLMHETITQVRLSCNPELKVYGILITRYKAQANHSKAMLQNLLTMGRALGYKVYKPTIRESIAIAEAQTQQQDIFTYTKASDPRSNGGRDYEAFIEELLTDLEENPKP